MLHEIDSLVFHVSRNYTQWLTFSPTLRLEMTGKWRCHSSVPVFSGLPREKHFGGEGHRVRCRITQQRETSSAHPKIRVLRLKYYSVLIMYRLASITFFKNSEYSYHGRNEPETLLPMTRTRASSTAQTMMNQTNVRILFADGESRVLCHLRARWCGDPVGFTSDIRSLRYIAQN